MSYSLQYLCTHELIKQIDLLQQLCVLERLPPNIRCNLLDRLSKRGVLTEHMLSQLVSLRLSELDLSECFLSNDRSIACLAECTQLRMLKMNNRSRSPRLPPEEQNITTCGFLTLLPSWGSLRELQLRACQFVDDQVLQCIATHCPLLRILNISSCALVTNAGISALSVCIHLFSIDLSHNPEITDEGLRAISQSSSRQIVSELNLSNCRQITDDGIYSLVTGCPRLRILITHGCPKLTGRSRQLLFYQTAAPADRGTRLSQVTWTFYPDQPNIQI